jgi:hypothetical protein
MRLRKRFIQSGRTYKDSTADENLLAERVRACGKKAELFDVKEEAPLVPKELHDLARHINSRSIDREEDFITFDYHLCRLSHARSLIDLCLGELLSAFRKADGKAYGEMGYSRLDDFAYEHLSFSGRLAHEGFRYITDDRYDGLSDEMREILRTGTWYKGPGSEWPIKIDDEYLLDKDFHNTVAFEMDTEQLSKCAADPDERADLPEANRLSKCATVHVEEADLSDRRSKCATDSGEEAGSTKSERLSKCAVDLEISSCKCREGHQHHYDEAIEEARALCTLPDKNRPAMTILLDVLDSLARQDSSGDEEVSSASGSHPARRPEPTMPIRFYLPSGLYGIWNDAVRRYTMLIPFEDGVELLVNNFGVENFMAILLTEYLLNVKAHHKAAHNNRVFERDGYKCQVLGCSNRRNIHSHHLEFRSHGGCDAQHNRLSLCAAHHLWILHILHGLKIEGTAPNELTFTFGPNSGPEGQPFMVYSSGRKVISPAAMVTRVIK